MAKTIVLALTKAEVDALRIAIGNFADYGEEEMRSLLHTKASVKAGYSAYEKLKAAS